MTLKEKRYTRGDLKLFTCDQNPLRMFHLSIQKLHGSIMGLASTMQEVLDSWRDEFLDLIQIFEALIP